jgi:hypothetical protein
LLVVAGLLNHAGCFYMLCCVSGAGMDVDEPAKAAADGDATTAAAADSSSGDKDGAAGAAGDDKAEGAAAAAGDKAKEKEPSSFTVTAPCRVVPHQVKHMALPQGA